MFQPVADFYASDKPAPQHLSPTHHSSQVFKRTSLHKPMAIYCSTSPTSAAFSYLLSKFSFAIVAQGCSLELALIALFHLLCQFFVHFYHLKPLSSNLRLFHIIFTDTLYVSL